MHGDWGSVSDPLSSVNPPALLLSSSLRVVELTFLLPRKNKLSACFSSKNGDFVIGCTVLSGSGFPELANC